MPTKQGGRALKNASTSDRCSFRRNTALPAASTPCSWKTRLAMSKPTVVIFMVDGSFSSLHSTARAWHIDAVRGRPPHQTGDNSDDRRDCDGGNETEQDLASGRPLPAAKILRQQRQRQIASSIRRSDRILADKVGCGEPKYRRAGEECEGK